MTEIKTLKRALPFYQMLNDFEKNFLSNYEEKNVFVRALLGFLNFPKSKKYLLSKVKEELKEVSEKLKNTQTHSVVKTTNHDQLYTQIKKIFEEIEGGIDKVEVSIKKVKSDDGEIVSQKLIVGEESFMFPPEMSQQEMVLHFLESGVCPKNGQHWSFERSFLYRFFNHYKVDVEAFSLSTNHTLQKYMSLFSEVDESPFCLGNFFTTDLPPSVYYVNPPYSEFLLKKAVQRALEYLGGKSKVGYGFLFVIPAWEDSEFWQTLFHSRYREDWYRFSGNNRPRVYSDRKSFNSTFDVDVFFLKNY